MRGKLDTNLRINDGTKLKILKMFGADHRSIQTAIFDSTNQKGQEREEFKILIITRGLIDKFSLKHQPDLRNKPKESLHSDPLLEKLREISERIPSVEYSLEKLYQNNDYFLILHKSCKKERIKLLIPKSIIMGTGLTEPARLWTNSKGFVDTISIAITDLKEEIMNFRNSNKPNYPAFIIRYEHHSSEHVYSKTLCFKSEEIEEAMAKISDLSYSTSLILISEFVISKGNLPSKLRVQFLNKCEKLFSITATEPKSITPVKETSMSICSFLPASLLNSLIQSKDELSVFQNSFHCTLIYPIKANLICFATDGDMQDFARFVYKVICFLQQVLKVIIDSNDYQAHASRLLLFNKYLKRKLKLIESVVCSADSPKCDKNYFIVERRSWEKSHLVHAFDKNSRVYKAVNSQKSIILGNQYQGLVASVKNQIPSSRKVREAVVDAIESVEGIFLIKVLSIRFEENKIVVLPGISSLKHISLFSATEGSGYIKGKKNNQLLCCGDYCSLLKRNDYETREKIEFLMKYYLDYAGTLFELMKFQDILNIDTVHHLLDRAKRPVTPITNNMQYKILRKIILEDRYDKYSLRSLILNLPNELIRELNLILQENTNISAMNIYLEKTNSSNAGLNKKLHWEFELVPVCDICYKIYSKRDKANKEISLQHKGRRQVSVSHLKNQSLSTVNNTVI